MAFTYLWTNNKWTTDKKKIQQFEDTHAEWLFYWTMFSNLEGLLEAQ